MKKRVISMLLAFCMTFSMLPANVLATETKAIVQETATEIQLDDSTSESESTVKEVSSEQEEKEEIISSETQTEEGEIEDTMLIESEKESESESIEESDEVFSEERYFDPFNWDDTSNNFAAKKFAITKSAINSAANSTYKAESGYGGELNELQKQVYDTLVNCYVGSDGLSNGSTGDMTFYPTDNSFGELSTNDLFTDLSYGYWAFVYDYPEVFWAGGVSISI